MDFSYALRGFFFLAFFGDARHDAYRQNRPTSLYAPIANYSKVYALFPQRKNRHQNLHFIFYSKFLINDEINENIEKWRKIKDVIIWF